MNSNRLDFDGETREKAHFVFNSTDSRDFSQERSISEQTWLAVEHHSVPQSSSSRYTYTTNCSACLDQQAVGLPSGCIIQETVASTLILKHAAT